MRALVVDLTTLPMTSMMILSAPNLLRSKELDETLIFLETRAMLPRLSRKRECAGLLSMPRAESAPRSSLQSPCDPVMNELYRSSRPMLPCGVLPQRSPSLQGKPPRLERL